MQASFPNGGPARGCGPAVWTLIPLALQSGSWVTFPPRGTVAYNPSWPEVSGSSIFHSAFMWVGDMLGNVVSSKMRSLLDSRESMQFYEHNPSESCEPVMMTEQWRTLHLGREEFSLGRILMPGSPHLPGPHPGPKGARCGSD